MPIEGVYAGRALAVILHGRGFGAHVVAGRFAFRTDSRAGDAAVETWVEGDVVASTKGAEGTDFNGRVGTGGTGWDQDIDEVFFYPSFHVVANAVTALDGAGDAGR